MPKQPFVSVTVTVIGNEPSCVGRAGQMTGRAVERDAGRQRAGLAPGRRAEDAGSGEGRSKADAGLDAGLARVRDGDGLAVDVSVYVAPMPLQPFASVARYGDREGARLTGRAGENAGRGVDRDSGRQRAGLGPGDRAVAAGLREGLAERRAGRAGGDSRVASR